MKLWLISQNEVFGYDTFNGAVVASETKEGAMQTHPRGYWYYDDDSWVWNWKRVQATLIGNAEPGTKAGVILASFRAG